MSRLLNPFFDPERIPAPPEANEQSKSLNTGQQGFFDFGKLFPGSREVITVLPIIFFPPAEESSVRTQALEISAARP